MKYFQKRATARKGFTLIELLVVISIIGVLAMIIVPNLVGVRERARDTKKKTELVQLKKSLRLYYNDNQSYPASGPTIGSAFTDGSGVVYMNEVPEYDEYGVSGDGEDFELKVALENLADPDIAASQAKCSGSLVSVTASTDYVVCQD